IAGARERFPGRKVRVLFQPHLYSRTRHLAAEFADALAAADDVTVVDVYPAREQPVPGVTGKLIVDQLSDRGVLAGWTPTVGRGGAGGARRRRCRSCGGAAAWLTSSRASRSRASRRSGPAGPRGGSRAPTRWTSWWLCCGGHERETRRSR